MPGKNSQKGFTLIELLVVIAIIAILATIGLIIYSSVQQRARDSKRGEDIKAISNSLETHYMTTAGNCPDGTAVAGGTYCSLQNGWFSNGGSLAPTDPGGASKTYCINFNSSSTAIADATNWTDNTCAGAGSGWVPLTTGKPTSGSTAWKACALLETSGKVSCLSNQQQ